MTSERRQGVVDAYDAALHLMRSEAPDPEGARRLLEEASAAGDARATYALATWYLHGTHVKKSIKQGVRLLGVAAEAKVRDALFDLAVSYETGRGIAKDRAKAFQLYKEAADLGDPQAMFEVGRMLHHGIGVPKDREAAERWLGDAESAALKAHAPLQAAV